MRKTCGHIIYENEPAIAANNGLRKIISESHIMSEDAVRFYGFESVSAFRLLHEKIRQKSSFAFFSSLSTQTHAEYSGPQSARHLSFHKKE